MDTIINKGRTTARKVEQYATRENLRAAKKEVNESLHNAAKDFKNSNIGKWIIGKVNAFTEIAKPYIDGFKQKITDIKREIDINAVIVGDFNTSLTSVGRSFTQKISRETQVLNGILDQS